MLPLTDDTDANQATHSGLSPPLADAGVPPSC